MKRKIVIVSIGVIALLVLVSFSTIVSAQAIKSNERQTSIVQQMKDKITSNNWKSGDFLGVLAGPPPWMYILFSIFSLILSFILGL